MQIEELAILMEQRRGSFGTVVREQREAQGLSQDQLAQRMQMSKGRIVDIEKLDAPSVHPSTFVGLARVFGMDATGLRALYEAEMSRRSVGTARAAPVAISLPAAMLAGLQKIAAGRGTSIDETARQLLCERLQDLDVSDPRSLPARSDAMPARGDRPDDAKNARFLAEESARRAAAAESGKATRGTEQERPEVQKEPREQLAARRRKAAGTKRPARRPRAAARVAAAIKDLPGIEVGAKPNTSMASKTREQAREAAR